MIFPQGFTQQRLLFVRTGLIFAYTNKSFDWFPLWNVLRLRKSTLRRNVLGLTRAHTHSTHMYACCALTWPELLERTTELDILIDKGLPSLSVYALLTFHSPTVYLHGYFLLLSGCRLLFYMRSHISVFVAFHTNPALVSTRTVEAWRQKQFKNF